MNLSQHETNDNYEILLNLNKLSFNEHNKYSELDPDEGIINLNNFKYYSTH